MIRQRPADRCPRRGRLGADHKCHNHNLTDWRRKTDPGPTRVAVTSRMDDDPGLKPIKWRGAIERTSGGVKRARRNPMDSEHTTASREAMVRIAMTEIMLNRLTDEKPELPFRHPKIKKTARIFLNRLSVTVP